MSRIRPVAAPLTNTQSTLCTAPNLCKNVSLAVLFGSKCNSHAIPTQSDMCIYTHVLHNTETLVGQEKLKKKWDNSRIARAKEIFPP